MDFCLLDVQDSRGLKPIDKSVLSGHLDQVKMLFEAGNYTEADSEKVLNGDRGEDDWSLLQMACASGDVEIFKWIESKVSRICHCNNH